jgi:hypothetical protein
VKNEDHNHTKIVAEHFNSIPYLEMLYNFEFEGLRKQVSLNIIASVVLLLIFFVTLVSTFTFLEVKSLSLIPLLSIFVVAFAIICLAVNVIRYRVINKVINGDYKIDKKFLKLFILKTIADTHEGRKKKKQLMDKEKILFTSPIKDRIIAEKLSPMLSQKSN